MKPSLHSSILAPGLSFLTELRVREFAMKDGWNTGAWTPQVWISR